MTGRQLRADQKQALRRRKRTQATPTPAITSESLSLQRLQRTAGNQAVTGLLTGGTTAAVQRDTPPGVVDAGEVIVDDGTGKDRNVAYATRIGKQDAKHIRDVHTLSTDDQNDVKAKRKYFKGAALTAYLAEVTPALEEVARAQTDKAAPAQDRAALLTQVTSTLSQIQKAKAVRIRDWLAVEGATKHDPAIAVLEAAITIFSGGVGGVVGGLITEGMADHSLMKEFVYLVGLEAADLATESAFKKALTWTQEHFEQSTSQALDKKTENATAALTSPNSAGQAARYASAVELQSISEEHQVGHDFLKAAGSLTDGELAFQAFVYEHLYQQIMRNPELFMRELTTGYIALKDAAYIDAPAGASPADISKLREKEFGKNKGERDFRSTGTVYLTPTDNGNLGNWGSPNYALNFSATVADVKKETLAHLVGSRIKDLPFNFSFRIPAVDPFYRFKKGERGIEIGFNRAPDGEFLEAKSREDDEKEWLASYWSGLAGELTAEERDSWSIHGVHKLYDALADRTITEVENGDAGLGDAIELDSKLHPDVGNF